MIKQMAYYPACALFMLWLLPASLVHGDVHASDAAKLTVRGEARLMIAPDTVSVILGVSTESAKAKKAIADNNTTMNKVMRALDVLGLSDAEYQTQQFRVQPIWTSRPKGAASTWAPNIASYRVSNTLRITTQQLEIVGELIGAATEAGANQVNSIQFSLSNSREYRSQAIAAAMANAKADAQTLADASGDRIKRTLSLNLNNAEASVAQADVRQLKSRMMMDSMAEASPPPIDAGDITVRASVSVVYELESQP